jgi:arsenate reductase
MIFAQLEKLIFSLNPETISDERKMILQPLVDFIQSKVNARQEIKLNCLLNLTLYAYICSL